MSDSDIDKLFQFLDKKIIEFRNKEKNNKDKDINKLLKILQEHYINTINPYYEEFIFNKKELDENSKKIIIDSILDVINFINELEKLNEQIIVKLRQLIKEELEKYKLLNEMSQPLIQFIGQIENLSRTQVMMKLYELVKNGKIRQSEFMIAVNEVISQLLKK